MKLTKHPAKVQFPHGNSAIPSSWGSAYMTYNNTTNPTLSIVAHPHFPLMFNRESFDVLPCGYHSTTHCTAVTCNGYHVSQGCPSSREAYMQDQERWALLTSGKNCQIVQISSQFSRDGGSQFWIIAIAGSMVREVVWSVKMGIWYVLFERGSARRLC